MFEFIERQISASNKAVYELRKSGSIKAVAIANYLKDDDKYEFIGQEPFKSMLVNSMLREGVIK